jgi:hypothetical protein
MDRAELFLSPRGEAWREEEDGVMMGFFSEKGRRGRHRFETAPISVDDNIR